jgi:LPXTG-site transpeptidase (sortase) family protein
LNLSKISFKKKLFAVIILILAISLWLIIYFSLKYKTQNIYVSSTDRQAEINLPADHSGYGLPVRLEIPKINVDAMVDSVGLTSDGAVDVPKGPADVAWFDLGPRPGENGSSVIDGHSGWKDGIPAIFDNLYKLQKGDKVYVKDAKGMTISFVVREILTYDPHADASNVFNSSDGKAHLNLITCTGTWNETDKTHSERLVVFTDRE